MFAPLKKVVYDGLIALELALERGLDWILPHEDPQTSLNELVTIVVKTFMRPRIIRRMIASVRDFYPDLPVIVVDDSRNAEAIPGVKTIILPCDSGYCVGRREGLREVQTRYVLLLDDDFVFYRRTRLGQVTALMEQNPVIDIMGGAVVNLPCFNVDDYKTAPLYRTPMQPTFPEGTLIGGLPTQEKIANFFIARTERLRLVPWDTNLRLVDHRDFFTRARGVLTTVYNPAFRCLHARTPFDRVYMEKRNDYSRDLEYLKQKYMGR